MDTLRKFFQFLSKTDPNVIRSPHCSGFVGMIQTALGVMVFITGFFAALSGGFAIYTAFRNTVLALIVGILYGTMIMAFDREIVSAPSKKAVWLRLPLAVLIGFIVAVPIEMRLLQDRLEKQLRVNEQTENMPAIERKNARLDQLRDRREQLEKDARRYREEVATWSSNMEAEVVGRVREGRTGKAGEGPAHRAARENKELNEKLLVDTQKQLGQVQAEEVEERRQIEADFNRTFILQTYGFLSQFEALEELKSQSAAAWEISWMLRLLFVFIEIFPALVKLLLPYSAYNALLEAKHRDSIQIIHSIANQRMAGVAAAQPNYPQKSLLTQANSTPPNP
jgi:uncharacterized membrane-anchored protein YhcB (DUF1043 family)